MVRLARLSPEALRDTSSPTVPLRTAESPLPGTEELSQMVASVNEQVAGFWHACRAVLLRKQVRPEQGQRWASTRSAKGTRSVRALAIMSLCVFLCVPLHL